jgi:hypothetical protein
MLRRRESWGRDAGVGVDGDMEGEETMVPWDKSMSVSRPTGKKSIVLTKS